jgi:hypothetical protein
VLGSRIQLRRIPYHADPRECKIKRIIGGNGFVNDGGQFDGKPLLGITCYSVIANTVCPSYSKEEVGIKDGETQYDFVVSFNVTIQLICNKKDYLKCGETSYDGRRISEDIETKLYLHELGHQMVNLHIIKEGKLVLIDVAKKEYVGTQSQIEEKKDVWSNIVSGFYIDAYVAKLDLARTEYHKKCVDNVFSEKDCHPWTICKDTNNICWESKAWLEQLCETSEFRTENEKIMAQLRTSLENYVLE